MSSAATATAEVTRSSRVSDFMALTKMRLVFLVLLTTLAGFHMGTAGALDWLALLAALVGTGLTGAGSQALNQYLERDSDAKMLRTRARPLPDGRIHPTEGLIFGLALTIAGLAILALGTNLLAAALALSTVATYLLAYTPLKRVSPAVTLVGCVPGALPPLIGWAAAQGSLTAAAWTLFGILFWWQVPHSLAIAWLHRGDYARAGSRVLPVVDPDGRATGLHVALGSAALLAAGLAPTALGLAGTPYAIAAAVAGVAVLAVSIDFARKLDAASARRVLVGSYLHLPLTLGVLALDKIP